MISVDDLPPALTTAQAAELLAVSPDLLWKLARTDAAPIEPIRLGRALRWRKRDVLELLHVPVRDEAPAPTADATVHNLFDPHQRINDDGSKSAS